MEAKRLSFTLKSSSISRFPITGAYRLRDSFLSAFTSKGDDKRLPTSSTSKFESLPVEVLLQVFSNSRITPPDLLSMGGTSERLRSILTEGRRVDSLTKDFIERSAPGYFQIRPTGGTVEATRTTITLSLERIKSSSNGKSVLQSTGVVRG